MSGIGIVGTGISGLQLALHLQASGVETTVYSPQSLPEHRSGRLPNLVVRWAPTIERERQLGVFQWESNGFEALHVEVTTAPDDPPLAFCGCLPAPANTTDFRLYLPALFEAYESRGGKVVLGSVGPEDLGRLSGQHELVVVAAGRDGFGGVFPRDAMRSPYEAPARHVTAGFYRGLVWPEPAGIDFVLVPGGGEILQLPFHSFDGPTSGLAVNAAPGGPLDVLSRFDHRQDPAAFDAAVAGVLEAYAPSIYRRLDRSSFGVARPDDLLRGRIVPVVRRAWTPLDNGRCAVAIGDAWILNDPIAAQGANLGSRCAFLMGEAIAAGGPYDETFCRRVEDRMWAAAMAPTVLSNALLEPPTEAVIDVLVRAGQDQALADRLVSGFGDPEDMLALLAPEPANC